MMTIELSILISGLGFAFALYQGLKNIKRNDKKDMEKEAMQVATTNVKLDSISRGIEDIKVENKTISKSVTDLNNRVIVVEQSVKSAHHRIDDIVESK